ncbi:MAG: hypothetical protein KatS3mg031_0032 [Chitinophagales bacterium]|nr:MAG: hypothetical protein KatS3mg031_0032 [Chitinophagales bacterium]
MKKTISKSFLMLAITGMILLSFSSCQREGCPGMITKNNVTQAAPQEVCN